MSFILITRIYLFEMDELRKVSSAQLYEFWKNLSVGLLMVIVMMAFSKLLPFFLSPVVSLICAAVLYTVLYNARISGRHSCMIVPYAIFFCLIAYSFVSIGLNVLSVWTTIEVPAEFIFFNGTYIPSLMFMPVGFIVLIVMYLRHSKLHVCVSCKLHNGSVSERGQLGKILSYESLFQLRNLIVLFGGLSLVIWAYYTIFYIRINTNARDWYVFTWLTIIAFVLDELYFIFRYYNLYLDLKESGDIISQDELNDMTAKTYLRYYLICGNSIYMNPRSLDPKMPYREVTDTPFFTRRSVGGIMVDEVGRIIGNMTGIRNGELRFFYGRRSSDLTNTSMLRYFYFLDGSPEDYPEIGVDGEWMDFEKLKKVYTAAPGKLSTMTLADLTRLATIVLTEKMFDERGFKKSRIKQYQPNFTLEDVRNSELDFQDDKWIKISMFNSDTPFYRIKRWWRGINGKSNNSSQWS